MMTLLIMLNDFHISVGRNKRSIAQQHIHAHAPHIIYAPYGSSHLFGAIIRRNALRLLRPTVLRPRVSYQCRAGYNPPAVAQQHIHADKPTLRFNKVLAVILQFIYRVLDVFHRQMGAFFGEAGLQFR